MNEEGGEVVVMTVSGSQQRDSSPDAVPTKSNAIMGGFKNAYSDKHSLIPKSPLEDSPPPSSPGQSSENIPTASAEDKLSPSNSTKALQHSSSYQNGGDQKEDSPLCENIPWNMDSIQTVVGKVPYGKSEDEAVSKTDKHLKEEIKELREAVSEAAKVNSHWQKFHKERQEYIQRLLKTIHDLQRSSSTSSIGIEPHQNGIGSPLLKIESDSCEGELKQLRAALAALQEEHLEHVALLEMQVRAHRDDWEAERTEKQDALTRLATAEAKAAVLLHENQSLKAKIAQFENRLDGISSPHLSRTNSPVDKPILLKIPSKSPSVFFADCPPFSLQQASSETRTEEHSKMSHKKWNSQSKASATPLFHEEPRSKDFQENTSTKPNIKEASIETNVRKDVQYLKNSLSEGEIFGTSDRETYELKGARPKVFQIASHVQADAPAHEDVKQAKTRARSILASALPISPVSSSPPSQPQANDNKIIPNSNSKNKYVPITSTVMTPVGFHTTVTSCSQEIACPKAEVLKDESAFFNEHEKCSKQVELISNNCDKTSGDDHKSKDLNAIQCSTVKHINLTSCPVEANKSNTTTFATITVTTTTANTTSVTSNYSSSTSSRSSSPGISLTTFALDSQGWGVPGAIRFALGAETKEYKSPSSGASPKSTVSLSPPSHKTAQKRKIMSSPKPEGKANLKSSIPGKSDHLWVVQNAGSINESGLQHQKHINSTWVNLTDANNSTQRNIAESSLKTGNSSPNKNANQLIIERNSLSPLPATPHSATATFTYTPAVNSTSSSSSSSSPSSPPSLLVPGSANHLKYLASKNISSAIVNYELSAYSDNEVKPSKSGVKKAVSQSSCKPTETITKVDIACPSCQMLFPFDKHINFLDHFEKCGGPKYIDM